MLKKTLLSLAAVFLLISTSFSNPNDTTKISPDLSEEDQLILDALDSLTYLLYSTNTFFLDTTALTSYEFESDDVPMYPDSVYAYRLSKISSPIDLEYNEYVRRYIDVYTMKKRAQVQKMLGLAQMYFPMFEEVLERHGLPHELKYLPVIESALNPHAVSRAGATGLWQFMYPTGKMYSLNINSYIDDRRDPYLATEAAARYLKDLYKMYGDWSLVLAAYNYGPGNLNKAIRRSGGKTNYWEIRNYLPAETRGYLPAFIAATYVMNYYQEHNISPMLSGIYSEPVDTINIKSDVSLEQVSHYTNVPVEEIAFLNPNLKSNKIPFAENGYNLRLPMKAISAYIDNKDSILYASITPVSPVNGDPVFTSESPNDEKVAVKAVNNNYKSESRPENSKLIYRVKSGDNLGSIAEWYNCSVTDLKRWNNLKSTRIYVGQKLAINVASKDLDKYKNIDNLSSSQKQTVMTQKSTGSSSSGYISYTIRKGDTLWELARRYPKNSVQDIKRLNNIPDAGDLKPGQVIKLAI